VKQPLRTSTWIAIAGAAILILILMVANPNALRVILTVPFVLFLPGFVLTLILFRWEGIGIPERLLLSVGVSVAFTALSGFLLNLTPWGLQAGSMWFILLITVAVELAVMFFARRSWRTDAVTFPAGFNFNTRQWVLMALAALLTVMAIRVARTPTPQPGLAGYTMLWIQDAGAPNAVHVSVKSDEFDTTRYQIKYQFNGTVREGSTFKLQPGETWERIVPLPAGVSAGNSFSVLLYRLDSPDQVYRRVIWWPNSQ
jgi:uncharacterized membrane protein